MGYMKRYIESLAEKLGKEFEEVTQDDMENDMLSSEYKEVVTLCCQTGSKCGYPCNGDCDVNGVKIAKID